MGNAKLLGKPIEFVATSGLNEKYGGIELTGYTHIALSLLQKYPYDMFIFSMADDNHFQVRLAGYNLETDILDESTMVFKAESLHIDTFWLKIDDLGEKYIGTFLFPEEY